MIGARARISAENTSVLQQTQNRIQQRMAKKPKYNKSTKAGKLTNTLPYNLNIIYSSVVVVTNLKSYLSCTNS